MSHSQAIVEPKPIPPGIPIPPEIDRWNWGAFLLNWIWGVGNNTFIALLSLIPLVGFVMMFVLGAKGSIWAWRNGRWDSVQHFKRVQRRWAIAGVIVWAAAIALLAGIFFGVFALLKHSEAYQLGVSRLHNSAIAEKVLGTPISVGNPTGSLSVNNGSGKASLSFSATGPRASGVVFLQAIKKNGVWSLTKLTLKLDRSGDVIDLVGGRSNST
jgi:hypothetical protein